MQANVEMTFRLILSSIQPSHSLQRKFRTDQVPYFRLRNLHVLRTHAAGRDFIGIEEDQRLLAEAVVIVQREAAGKVKTFVLQLRGCGELSFIAEVNLCNRDQSWQRALFQDGS
jgi:hypothetical protein